MRTRRRRLRHPAGRLAGAAAVCAHSPGRPASPPSSPGSVRSVPPRCRSRPSRRGPLGPSAAGDRTARHQTGRRGGAGASAPITYVQAPSVSSSSSTRWRTPLPHLRHPREDRDGHQAHPRIDTPAMGTTLSVYGPAEAFDAGPGGRGRATFRRRGAAVQPVPPRQRAVASEPSRGHVGDASRTASSRCSGTRWIGRIDRRSVRPDGASCRRIRRLRSGSRRGDPRGEGRAATPGPVRAMGRDRARRRRVRLPPGVGLDLGGVAKGLERRPRGRAAISARACRGCSSQPGVTCASAEHAPSLRDRRRGP